MTLTPIPEGWTVEKGRFLYNLINPEGELVLSGDTEEACRRCLYCLPEFGGIAHAHTVPAHVDL